MTQLAVEKKLKSDRNISKIYSQKAFVGIFGVAATMTLFLGGCGSSPTQTASSPASPATKTEASPASTTKSATTGSKVNINAATIAELDKLELPGTKPSLSERIEGKRPYATPEDMVTKKAISPEEYALIKNLVTTEK